MKDISKIISLCIIALLLFAVQLFPQTQNKLSVKWIYSDASAEITKVPSFSWQDDGNVIIYNTRLPQKERTFELYNPKTDGTKEAINKYDAMKSLNSLLSENENEINFLKWPLEFSKDGSEALYLINDDIFLLNLSESKFYRITNTDKIEKDVNLSPDGNKIAFVRDNDLYVYDIPSYKETRITNDGSDTILNGTLSWVYWEEVFGRRDIGYWWSPDSKSLAFLRTDQSPVEPSIFVDFKPQYPKVIKQRYPKAGNPNPIVTAGIANVNNSKVTWIQLDPDNYEYLVRINWLPESQRVAVQTMNRAQDTLQLFFADKNDGGVQHIMTETNPGWVNINDDLTFLKDSDEFLWVSERDGYSHIYRYKNDGELINQITKGNWSVRSAGGGVHWLRKGIVSVDEKAQLVYFTALKKSSIEKHLYKVKFDGTQLDRITQKDGTHSITFGPNVNYYFDQFSNVSTPPSLKLYNITGKLLNKFAEARLDLLAKLDLQFPKQFHVPASDGFEMPAEVYTPADFDSTKKYPLIFYMYSGPSAPQVLNVFDDEVYFNNILLQNGYLIASVDNRSATAISKILENTILKQMAGPSELKDFVDAVHWFKNKNWIDTNRIGIWGWSGGGSFTLNALTHTKEFKAGISVAPVTDWHFYDTKWTEFAMKLPEDNPEGYEVTSVLNSAKDLHGKLLLVFGTYDDNVHPQNEWAFIDELIKANKMFDLMIYPMRKHGISDEPARIHLYTRMLEFWKNNL